MAGDLVVCVATEGEAELLRSRVPVITTGVGAVNAAYTLTRFLSREQVGSIVVCGIEGAYPGSGLPIGTAVCAETECYGDLGASSPGGFLDMRALGFAVGRNNWTFFGSDNGGKTAAVLRSFVTSCELVKIDPFAWFRDVLGRIADHPVHRLDELLPHRWAQAIR